MVIFGMTSYNFIVLQAREENCTDESEDGKNELKHENKRQS